MRSELREAEGGEFRDIDDYIAMLRSHGFDADYENVVDDALGFVAVVTVDGEQHATWESKPGGQMVRDIQATLHEIEKQRDSVMARFWQQETPMIQDNISPTGEKWVNQFTGVELFVSEVPEYGEGTWSVAAFTELGSPLIGADCKLFENEEEANAFAEQWRRTHVVTVISPLKEKGVDA